MRKEMREPWLVLALLTVSIAINYIDRGALSVAADPIARELALDPAHVGYLLSAFFWTYAGSQVFVGWLVDRGPVYWILAAGFFIWSVATMLTGFAQGFAVIFALRLMLGVGESVAYPSYSRIIARGFPEHRHGLTNAIIDLGSKSGPALGVMIGGGIVTGLGWRMMFLVIGACTMVWLAPWCWVARRETKRETHVAPVASGWRPGWKDILRLRPAWATFLALFAGNYAWYFLITWLPWYLVRERHYSNERMAILGSLPFWGVGLSSLASGWISDLLVARGANAGRTRKIFAASGLLLGMLMLPVSVIQNETVSLTLLIAACVCFGMYSSHIWLITQRLAGPLASGQWSGFQNAIGNLAGIAAPTITGWIVNETGSFFYAFATTASILAVGASSYLFLAGPIEPIVWQSNRLGNTSARNA